MTQRDIVVAARKISFSVDESKTWTDNDDKLLATYLHLHEKERQLKLRGTELVEKFRIVNKEVETARTILETVTNNIAAVSKLADGFLTIDPNKQRKAEKIIEKANETSEMIHSYQQFLEQLDEKVAANAEMNSAFVEDIENFDVWDAYDNVRSEHFRNYEMNSIDIASFDLDDETFRDFVSAWDNQNKSATDYSNAAIDNYNKLLLETKVQYGKWEEFLKRVALIRLVLEDRTGEIFTSPN